MTSVMPKVKLYAFLSIICLMINIAVFFTVALQDNTDFGSVTNTEIYKDDDLLTDNETVDIGTFVYSTGGSYIPFYSLIPIATLDLPLEVSIIAGIVITMISAFQVFLLLVIIFNMIPKVLGSGWDV